MKKLAALMLTAALVFTMTACAAVAPAPAAAPAPAEETAAEPAEAPAEEEAPAETAEAPSEWPVVKVEVVCAADMHNKDNVQNALNEYLVSIDAGLQTELIPLEFGERATTLTLMLTDSDDPIDLYTWRWYSNVSSLVKNDQCISLEPYRDAYPELFTMFPEGVYKACQVAGEQYSLPVADAFGSFQLYAMRKDIAEEIGAIDLADQLITMDQLNDILAKAEEAHPDMSWINDTNAPALQNIDNLGDGMAIGVLMNRGNGETEIINYYASDEWKAYIDQCKAWADGGLFVDDPLNNPMIPGDMINQGLMGGYFSEAYSLDYFYSLTKLLNTYEMVLFRLSSPGCTNSNVGAGWVISSVCKDPDTAMKMLNLMYTDENVMHYLGQGIEGEQYVVDENGCAWFAEGVTADNAGWHCTAPWFYPNPTLCYPFETDYAAYYTDMIDFWANPENTYSNAMGFIFDSTEVYDQYTACVNTVQEYRGALLYGQVDVDEYNRQFNEELIADGIDDVIAEMNRQFAAFLEGAE